MKPRKCAGTSVQVNLAQHCGKDDIITGIKEDLKNYQSQNDEEFEGHETIEEVRGKVDKDFWDNFYIFTICRNPWDFMVSKFWWHGGFRNIPFREAILSDKLWINNDEFVGEDIDKYIRFNHLEEDYRDICRDIGLPYTELPHLKSGYRKSSAHYSGYYDKESKEAVRERYSNYIDHFDYSFEEPRQYEDSNPIFVLSAGRSGSQSVARMFDQYNGVVGLHEPVPRMVGENRISYLAKDNPIYQDEIKAEDILKRRYYINDFLDSGMYYVESSHWLSALIPQLAEAFPNAIFIHLIRDGRDVVRSGMQRNWYSDNLDDVGANWEWKPMNWPSPAETRLGKCCWRWSEVNRIIREDLQEIENDNFIIKLEHLKSDLTFVANRVGLKGEMEECHVNQGSSNKEISWDKKIVDKWMGEELERYGY